MKIRRAVLTDAPALAAVEQTQPQAAGWGEAGFVSELKLKFSAVLCAQQEQEIVGFIAWRAAADSAEILNVAVRSDCVRRGIGQQLVAQALHELQKAGVRYVSLEVAQANAAACALYAKAAMKQLNERKDFYGPGRSAWILGKQL